MSRGRQPLTAATYAFRGGPGRRRLGCGARPDALPAAAHCFEVWLFHGMRSGRVPWRGVAREGCALLEVALPVLADRWLGPRARRRVMDRVVIGMDPHKASVTIEARDSREVLRARGRFGTDKRNYALMLRTARQWPDRLWAVEGANGIGRPMAQRLLADGERVLDVPAKLAARARVFDTGQGRKTDATDAHAIVM